MAVFDLHHPLVFVFGVLGNIVSILVYFAPLPIFIRICKAKSTMGYHAVPYVVALFSAMLWMYYAFLKKNAPLLISINSFGCVIETIYISIFLAYATKDAKRQTVKLVILLIGVLYSGIFLATIFPFSGTLRVNIVGWICVAISVCVFASPLSVVLPNVLGFILGMVQMVLYGIYRNAKPVKAAGEEKKAVPAEHIINVVVIGAAEQVHPVNEITETPVVEDDGGKNRGEEHDERRTIPRPPEIPDGDDESSSQLGQVNSVHMEQPVLVVCSAA
nr:bidirectional sugar transporter N3-like [Ipomoea batatas]